MAKMKYTIYCILLSVTSASFIQDASSEDSRIKNTANGDELNLIGIVLFCAILCFAIRHANDFYHGQSVTLVPEGMEPHRFRKQIKEDYLTRIENDFQNMFEQLVDKPTDETTLTSLEHTWCC